MSGEFDIEFDIEFDTSSAALHTPHPVRARMRQRATIERDVASETNPYGKKGPPVWEADDDQVPCFFTLPRGREAVAVERTVGEIDGVILVPLGTDISDRNRINGIVDRLGNTIVSGVMNIRDVAREHTHLRVLLQEAS